MMKQSGESTTDLAIVARQWQELIGYPFTMRQANEPSMKMLRLDSAFQVLAERAFDDPTFLDRLTRMSAQWLQRCNCETTRAIAGYAAYLRDDFGRAVTLFLSCIALSPLNLDNWEDAAFALNHSGSDLGRHILFNLDEYASRFAAAGDRLCTVSRLEAIRAAIDADGASYAERWQEWYLRDR